MFGQYMLVKLLVCIGVSLLSIPVGHYEEEHNTRTWYRLFPFTLGAVGMFGLVLSTF